MYEIITTTLEEPELYKPKKVPEVWLWKSNFIKIFSLNQRGEYEEVERSGFFPDLDPALLLRYLAMSDQYDAVQEFVQAVRNELNR